MSVTEENQLLKMVIGTQASHIKEQEETIRELRTMVDELRSLKANLEETLEELRRQFFGSKSEKTSSKTASAEKTKAVPVKAHTRQRRPKATREELYANLPIREILCPVEESEKFCDWCNAGMVSISSKFVREELRITLAKVERIHYMQEVLACPECRKDHDGSFKAGEVPKALLPHSPASASAAAYVMFHKAFMGLPYYRMEKKNSLFHTSVDGAAASSIIYSLVETAKVNNLNVFQYIYTLLLYMPDYKNEPAGTEQLLPWSDFIREHCSGLIDVENFTAENHPQLPV